MDQPLTYGESKAKLSALVGKAVRAALVATAIGLTTGLICGVALPYIGAWMGPESLEFFSGFAANNLAVFLGFSSGISAFLSSGLDSTIAAVKLAREQRANVLAREPELEQEKYLSLEPYRQEQGVVIPAVPAPEHSIHDNYTALPVKATPHHADLTNAPTLSIVEANYDSRLQQPLEIGTLKVH